MIVMNRLVVNRLGRDSNNDTDRSFVGRVGRDLYYYLGSEATE